MAIQRINYNEIKYTFSAVYFDASGLRLEAAEDLPEGAVLKIDSTGKLALCDAAERAVGVNRFPVSQGAQAVCETKCVIKNNGTSLSLTEGSAVFVAADGAISDTGTVEIGTAMGPDEVFVNV